MSQKKLKVYIKFKKKMLKIDLKEWIANKKVELKNYKRFMFTFSIFYKKKKNYNLNKTLSKLTLTEINKE